MNIRHLLGLLIITMLSIDSGCTQTDEGFDMCSALGNGDLQTCSAFCNAAAQCEWGDSSQNDDTPGNYYEGQCMMKCSFYVLRGAFVVRRSTACEEYDAEADVCWKQVEQEEFIGNLGGATVEKYLGCLADLGAWKCNSRRHEMVIESAEECSRYAVCVASLGDSIIPTPQWEDGQCISASEANETFYVDIVL